DKPIDNKADIYSFGVLAYYLIMGEFPEGIFAFPSERMPEATFDWDALIRLCLQSDPKKRPEALLPLFHPSKTSLEKAIELVVKAEGITVAQELKQVVRSVPVGAEPTSHGVQNLKPIIRVAALERPDTDLDPAAAFHIDSSVKQYKPERKEIKNTQPILTDM